MKFMKYMSFTHLASKNIAMYRLLSGRCSLVVERLDGPIDLQIATFDSPQQAQDWYDDLDGSGLGRLSTAMRLIAELTEAA